MIVDMASRPGNSARQNLDWHGATDTCAVLLDGVSEPADTNTGCRHGTYWYVNQLGSALLRYACVAPRLSLADMLAHTIEDVAREHSSACNLDHPSSPAATVVMLHHRGPETHYLVLSDSTLAMDLDDGLVVVTNPPADSVVPGERKKVFRHSIGSPEHAEHLAHMVEAQRRFRNRKNGYWVASSNPDAADYARTGSVESERIGSALLLSDGVGRLNEWGIYDWEDMLAIARADGPSALIRKVRSAEARDPYGLAYPRFSTSDDATAILVRPGMDYPDTPVGGE